MQAVLDTIAGKLVDPVIQLVMVHVGFLFQYKKKLKNLDDEIENLEEHIKQIKKKVKEAITRGEEVDEPVLTWLADVGRVPEFKDDNTVNENMQCFIFLCPDYVSRYRMGKEAENKMEEVKNLTQRDNFSTVAHPKPFAQELQFTSSIKHENFESRELVFNNIMAALLDSEVKMIGVYGTGGVGKTTMVEEIGKQAKNGHFDEVVMAVVSQDANVSSIQGQLADRLSLKLKGETEVGKASELWNRLNNGMKNLIILDDIWQELNLKKIGVPITDGNKGCKIVITSRIRSVLEKMEVDRKKMKVFPMHVLLEKEAWALFKKKVGNSVDSPELHDIAYAICKECGGLPVAILAVGAALKDKEKYVWEDVLDQFKDSMLKNILGIDPKVYTSLKLSYDRLESSDAKSCFLLCCFFPEDANISIKVLARHCLARSLLGQDTNTLIRARTRVLTVVKTLKDACLLLEGKDENFVKMHDVIRDVALSIAKDDGKEILVKHGVKEWPERDTCESSSAISLRFDNTLELPDDLVCPQLHTLTILLKWNINPLLNVPDRFFSGMEKLTILELNRICMLSPLSLANLVNLRMLWLDYCELGDIAILKDLNNNLEILSLRGSNIEVLPSEIGQLTRLRLLDLENCYNLTEIPQGVISNLSRLEELYILLEYEYAYREDEIKVNLDELRKLTQLTTLQIHIPNVMLLPKDFCFKNLIRFKISVGKAYDFYGTTSKSCKLAGVSLMDKLIDLMRSAQDLHLEKIEGLQEFLHDRGAEGSLMERGRNSPGFFNNLIQLTIQDCRLKYLFSLSCARGFRQLQRLAVIDCEMMEAIVGIEEEKDEDEHSSQVTFPALKSLIIDRLPKITEIWDKKLLPLEFFRQLRDVMIKSCEKLVKVIVLENGEEEKKTENNNTTISFPQLTILRLEDLQSLKSFCTSRSETQSLFTSQVAFPVLNRLEIQELPNIIEIWDKQLPIAPEKESKSFCQLKHMMVSNCEKLVHVVQFNMLPQLQNMNIFSVNNCPKMEAIVSEKAKEGITSNDIIMLSQLTDPRGILGFQSLQYLTIAKCSVLRNLFTCSTAMALQQLKVLYLESCPVIEEVIAATIEDGLKEVIDDVIEFSKLEWLILKDLPNLNSFCNNANYNFYLPSLERVVLKRCPKMHNFAFGQVCMPHILVSTHGDKGIQTDNLNKYLEERLLKREECATLDESDYDGEERCFSPMCDS
ncbi:hypothetical protein HYC85_013051 [Camellia sinensis]|uniref:AAA+ ATPase domain-containing protein n=1 Tax=Camellia sinensis TaxID=4442 RepID=A0A7J7HGG7_CAMSI|nr:hypothetical protein HYC85_013051 [Camellia sinensis]